MGNCATISFISQITQNTKICPVTPRIGGSSEESVLQTRLKPAENVIIHFVPTYIRICNLIIIKKKKYLCFLFLWIIHKKLSLISVHYLLLFIYFYNNHIRKHKNRFLKILHKYLYISLYICTVWRKLTRDVGRYYYHCDYWTKC